MHFQALLATSLSLLGIAAAQSIAPSSTTVQKPATLPTSTQQPTDTTSLPSLIAQLPTCALPCFASASTQIGCKGPTDFACLCNTAHATDLATNVGLCIGFGGTCDLSKVASLAGNICSAVNGNPSAADLASASAEVSAALATATASSTKSGNAGSRPTGVAMGAALGAAVAVAACVV